MPLDPNVPINQIWFITKEALEEIERMSGYAIPPEHLPSEESNWMQNNDYGYAAKNENVMAKASPMSKEDEIMANLGDKAQQAFETYGFASRALSQAQSDYDQAARALKELRDRYQKAFFQMNENLGELNEWLNSRQKSQSDDS